MSVINQIVDEQLVNIREGRLPKIKVNRRKAFDYFDKGNIDHDGKHSVFGQIITQLYREMYTDMDNFRKRDVD